MTYSDESLDLVLHMFLLEHVRHPRSALHECRRVLEPGGLLNFEVPMTDPGAPGIRDRTVKRIDTSTDLDIPLKEPAYHGDPLRTQGPLVYTDFGLDLVGELESMEFSVDARKMKIASTSMSQVVVLVCRKRTQ